MGKVLELNTSNFDDTIKNSSPVMVDFWAAWCGPCKMIAPIVEELANDYDGKAIVGKVDVDANPELSQRYNIRSIPTLLVFKAGEVVDKHVGAASKSTLAKKLEDQMALS